MVCPINVFLTCSSTINEAQHPQFLPLFLSFFAKKKSFVWMDLPVTVEVQHSKILMFPFSSSTDKNRYGSGHVQEADK